MKDTPCHHHVDSQARLNAIGTAQLSLFDLATAFHGTVKDFYPPAFGIPPNLLHSLIKVFDRHRCKKHPLKWLYALGTIDLLSQTRSDVKFIKLKFSMRGSQLHSPTAYFQARLSGPTLTLTRHAEDFRSRHRLLGHVLPQSTLAIGQEPIMLSAYQQLRATRVVQGQVEKLLTVVFPDGP